MTELFKLTLTDGCVAATLASSLKVVGSIPALRAQGSALVFHSHHCRETFVSVPHGVSVAFTVPRAVPAEKTAKQ